MGSHAKDIVQKIFDAFNEKNARPTPEQVEVVMRPLAPESFLLREEIKRLLVKNIYLHFAIDAWMEANMVVSRDGNEKEQAIQFLCTDTCTCVLDHLSGAIEHAIGQVDARILKLLNDEYFTKKSI